MAEFSRRSFVAGGGIAALGGALALVGCAPSAKGESVSATGSETQGGASVAATGTGMGKKGAMEVEVVVTDGAIERISVLRSHETPTLGDAATKALTDLIIDRQTLDVDMVTGATTSSMAFVDAVSSALDALGMDSNEWKKRDRAAFERKEPLPDNADVVIVGSGGAGLAAGLTAAEQGKRVVILEKMGVFGGSTSLSGGETAAPGTWRQRREGIEDSVELLKNDMLIGGDNEGDPDLVEVIATKAPDTVDWLTYNGCVSWAAKLMFFGGHSVKRSLVPISHSGSELVSKLIDRAGEFENLSMVANVKVTNLVQNEDGSIGGVKLEDQLTGETSTLTSKAVVLATGGFGANVDMRVENNPDMGEKVLATVAKGAMGDGLVMGQEIGADLVDMGYIQTYPTCDPENGSLLYTGDFRVEDRAIMVNKEGKRFVEELERRDVLSKAIVAQTGGVAYMLFTEQAEADLKLLEKTYPEEYENVSSRGVLVYGDTLEEACESFGVDAAALKETIETWNSYCEQGEDPEFHYRSAMNPLETDGGFYLLEHTPAVHYTMGGLRINVNAEVLDRDGSPIPGLYAAGEVAGGKMGTNRLGATSMLDIFGFGQIAGANAAAVE